MPVNNRLVGRVEDVVRKQAANRCTGGRREHERGEAHGTIDDPYGRDGNHELAWDDREHQRGFECSVESRDCGGIDRYIGKDEAEEDRYGRSGSPRLHADM